jgi:hypothetical protein
LFNISKSLNSISTRAFDSTVEFPIIPPIVSFTGPIVGSGHTLLNNDIEPGFLDSQKKCCGFVQLSSFIQSGDPTKTPFKGYNPFCVFVIFPIHVLPWTQLCKGMIDRRDSRFQLNTTFSCTGKVVGLLDHRLMTQPPLLAQDYVFIVVPDTWTFHERTARASTTGFSPSNTPDKSSSGPLDRSQFLSPSKRLAKPASTPDAAAQAAGQPSSEPATSPIAASKESQGNSSVGSKRRTEQDTSSSSSKKARTTSK